MNISFPSDQQLSSAKILIVDDEHAHVRVLEWALKQSHFSNYRSVTDSTQAREEFTRFQPDIVLLDINMPQLDGFGVLRQIKELVRPEEFVPVLMLTGENTAETRSSALAAGAHDFLSKPLDYTEVMLRIKNLLQTRFLYRQTQEMKEQLNALTKEKALGKTAKKKP